jgi:hypothetical protein
MMRSAILALAVILGACTFQPELAEYPGAAPQIRAYYERNAWEQNATCTRNLIQAITGADVVEDTPDRLVLAVRYRYEPFNRIQDFGRLSCRDWGKRNFTFRKVDGSLQLVGMTGEQRRS